MPFQKQTFDGLLRCGKQMGKNENGNTEYLWRDHKRTIFGLPWSFTIYSLTEERLFIEKGFFNLKRDEVRLYRIMDISLSRTLGQRIFGLGTIRCCSGDRSLGDFEIKNIKNSTAVMEQLSSLIEKERDRKRVSSREFLHDEHEGHLDEDYEDDYRN